MFGLHAVLTLIGLGLSVRLFWSLRVGSRPQDHPPGPPTIPILGNLHQMIGRQSHKLFQELAKTYGEIFSLKLGHKTLVVLSSDRAVRECMDKQTKTSSGRAKFYLGHDVMSGGERMLTQDDPIKLKLQKKLITGVLTASAVETYDPYISLETKATLFDLLHTPTEFLWHMKRYSHSISGCITYGTRTARFDNPDMSAFFAGLDHVTNIMQTSAAVLVDLYSVARIVPAFMIPIVGRAEKHHREELDRHMREWNKAKVQIETGTAHPCFAVDLYHKRESEHLSEKFCAYLTAGFMEGGSETSSNVIYGFIQAMLLHQQVQREAQAEIDRVVGDRFPEFRDRVSLPYIRCLVKETLRWMPIAPTGGAAHCVTKDCKLMGYSVPEGALLINNCYTIHFDEGRYPDARRFDPMRFWSDDTTSAESAKQPDVSKRDHFSFGAGNRLCSGMHLADRTLFSMIAGMLWAMDIRPIVDTATGEDILPDPGIYTPNIICRPVDFSASINPRSPERANAIRHLWAEARKNLNEKGQWKESPRERR